MIHLSLFSLLYSIRELSINTAKFDCCSKCITYNVHEQNLIINYNLKWVNQCGLSATSLKF